MKVRRPGKTNQHILERDRKSDEPTVFIGRALTWQEMDEVSMLSPMTMEDAFKINAIQLQAAAEERELTTEENESIVEISSMNKEKLHQLTVQHAKACRLGLIKIKNLLFDEDEEEDETNKSEIKKTPDEISIDQFVDISDPQAIRELGTWIINLSKISVKDKKKS